MSVIRVGKQIPVEIIRTGLNKANTETKQIVLTFQDEAGDTIDAFLAITEKAWPYTEGKLKAAGWDPEANDYDFSQFEREDPPCAIVGMKTTIDVVCDTYEGKTRNKVSWIGEGGARERMAPEDAKTFADDLRKQVLAWKGPSQTKAPPPTSTTKAPAKTAASAGRKPTWG